MTLTSKEEKHRQFLMNVTSSLIKEARRSKGYTQKYLSSLLGCSQTSVESWENNICLPSGTNLLNLQRVLGIPADKILKLTTPTSRLNREFVEAQTKDETPYPYKTYNPPWGEESVKDCPISEI